MTEPSILRSKSEFHRRVILPSKSYKEKDQRPVKQVKALALNYEKQDPLGKIDTDKYRNSLKRQLSVDMLRQGYHQSFRELIAILDWQKEDRQRLGNEHPLCRRPFLDDEPEKLRFLCTYLNKVEEAERRRLYAAMYKNYLELASFFIKTDDFWLSDSFYEKCLMVAQTYSQLDPQFAAEAYLNVGLVFERHGELFKALEHFEQYRELSEDRYQLRTDANLQLTRIFFKLAERRGNDQTLHYVLQAYDAAEKSHDDKVWNEASYRLGEIYLQQGDLDSALRFLQRYYDYCESTGDHDGFGRASEALAICYQKKSDVQKSMEYLNKYLGKVSDEQKDPQYDRACAALGLIQTTLGDYNSAVKSLSKAYSVSLANQRADLDRHRVLYGIANGLKLRSFFNDHIAHGNSHDVVLWKSIRLERYLLQCHVLNF